MYPAVIKSVIDIRPSGKSAMIHKLRELTGGSTFPEEKFSEMRALYSAQCAFVDDMFAMVCDALKQAGIYDDSAIFLSDHGDFCGDYDLPEKAQNCFEHCLTRVPLMIKPPKGYPLDAGITDSLAELMDFYATAMDVAKVTPDHTHYGKSLLPIVSDRSVKLRKYAFSEGGRNAGETHCDEWHSSGPEGPNRTNSYWAKKTAQKDDAAHTKGTMIFDGRYKYIHRAAGEDEFYDLQTDAGERTNLIDHVPTEKLDELKDALMDWYQQTSDIVPYQLDNRLSVNAIWQQIRPMVPEGQEEIYKSAIRGKEFDEVAQICMKLLVESAKQKAKPEAANQSIK